MGFQSVASNRHHAHLAGAMNAQGRENSCGQLAVQCDMVVHRLTPSEFERFQGLPDDYTLIPWRRKVAKDCPDGPRYRALGNSMAVPVMQWIGSLIKALSCKIPACVLFVVRQQRLCYQIGMPVPLRGLGWVQIPQLH
jgi:DNA (cytosine-5)-methyltransferase 1